jgi:uncharacterized protein DUF6916
MEPMLDKLTVGDFQGRMGETFRAETPGGVVAFVLTEAKDLAGRSASDGSRRIPFSLVFRGPLAPVLPQKIYALENEALGRLEIFLVPIGPDAESMRYEAIFN